jgi:DNA-directed RNA polymerase specialized sigma24 family protein
MTEQQLERHRKWCRCKYGIDGEDIFQRACEMAIRKYKKIEKVNQSLFGLICRWAARELFSYRAHEIPFSCLSTENADQTDEMEYDPMDPEWEKDFVVVEEREEIEKIHGKWLLNALLSATEPKTIPAREEEKEEEQLKFEFA